MELLNKKAPQFTLTNQNGDRVTLADLKGKTVVLYFYPKDMTLGCTTQACDFRDRLAKFNKLDAIVLGISKDDAKSHLKFIEKEGLTFDLLVDPDRKTVEDYGVWKEKSMYGKKYMGIERSTFVINGSGVVVAEWRNVKIPGHVDQVLSFVEGM